MIDLHAGGYTISARFGAAFEADNVGGDMLGLGISLTRANLSVSVRTLDFTTGVLPAGVTFTRAGSATYFDAAGVLQTAAADVPRLDYDPVTLAPRGLLMEESRTNLFLQSQDATNAYWIKSSCTATANKSIAPDGVPDMDRITDTTDGASTRHSLFRNNGAVASGAWYCMSRFVRAGTSEKIELMFAGAAYLAAPKCILDPALGTVSLTGAGTLGGAIPVSPGVWRLWIAAQSIAAGDLLTYASTNNGSTDQYIGSGTRYFDTWGAQLEAGAFPTSYITTATAAATRAADQPRITANLGTRDVRVTTEAGVQVLTAQALTGSYWPALTGPQHIRKIEVL